jgi:hypothetical protein
MEGVENIGTVSKLTHNQTSFWSVFKKKNQCQICEYGRIQGWVCPLQQEVPTPSRKPPYLALKQGCGIWGFDVHLLGHLKGDANLGIDMEVISIQLYKMSSS